MKLRLQGNSIRVRLNRKEVAEFAEAGRVEDAVDFGAGTMLAYVLETSKDAEAPRAFLAAQVIRIEVPDADAQDWVRTDRVGISGRHNQLSILVEKDFQCIHEHPDPDAYPNPDAAHH